MTQLDELVQKAKTFPALFSLKGKNALVVGGNKGLGQAMAIALAGAGADVCVCGRGPAGLKETAEAITRVGRKGVSVAADATIEADVDRMVGETLDALGGIDILVNSQGIAHLQAAVEFDMDIWQKVMDVNLKSLVLTCKAVGKLMLEKGYGKIINVSSVRGSQARANDLAYAPSKGAVNQLSRSLAIEWGPLGVNVNTIGPCFVRTEISAPILDDPARREWVLSRIPLKRLSVPEDMFGPVIFLASDASAFVNGHLLMIDGGWLIA